MSYKVTNSFRENPNIYRLYDLENSSCTERNLIGRRTESDRTADGIRSDGERCFKGVHLSPLGFAACQSKKCTKQEVYQASKKTD